VCRPAMLLSAGIPLPTTIVVHGFVTRAGPRMSKALGQR
jgi:methionyl-tRNA synthetase